MLDVARQETWIKTPYSYIKMGGKLTLLQQDVMLMVSAHLQQYVKQFFDLKLNNSDADPLPLFATHLLTDGIPPFRIYFADMGISTSNYKSVREAIEEMNLLVEVSEFNDKGRATGATVFVPVFKCFRVPQMEGKYVKKNESGETIVSSDRFAGYVEVEINNKVAQYSFNMLKGYVTHPLPIARYATKRSTPRLYFFLQQRMGKERSATVYCTVQELKDFLGFETYKDEKTGEWVVPYAKFAHFKTKILDVVKQDLDEMAREDHSDITFTYQPIYRNGRKRGDPDSIEFQIVSTQLGLGYNLMTGIDTPAVRLAKERETKAQQLDLFADEEAQRWSDVWTNCQQDLLSKATRDDSRNIVGGMRFESFDASSCRLIIQLPNQEAYDFLEQAVVVKNIIQPTLMKHFGKNVELQYRLPKKHVG